MTNDGTVRAGVIGCGNISGIYLENSHWLPHFEVVACADQAPERAKAQAEEHNIPRCLDASELLNDPDIELVINLTTPGAHASIARAAIEAGKSVYNEKPLTLSRAESAELLEKAAARGVCVGCAPDTFLGGGLQTCRELVDAGAIGEPVAAVANMACPGHEGWHPDPEFYYAEGGGPLFDMGPYYLTALVNILGPVRRVTGSARVSFPQRTITSEPKRGQRIDVETPTHVAGVLDFAEGPIASLLMSFDVWAHELPRLEIHGSEGSLALPDPNTFGGPVRLWIPAKGEWEEIPIRREYTANCRGLGVADMAAALRRGDNRFRASGRLAYHVLDTMHAVLEAPRENRHIAIESVCERPDPFPEAELFQSFGIR